MKPIPTRARNAPPSTCARATDRHPFCTDISLDYMQPVPETLRHKNGVNAGGIYPILFHSRSPVWASNLERAFSALAKMAITGKIASTCGGMSQPLALRYNVLICAAEPNSASRLNGERVMGLLGFYRSDCPDRPYETWCEMQALTALLALSPVLTLTARQSHESSADPDPRKPEAGGSLLYTDLNA